MKHIFLLLLSCAPLCLRAQNAPCPQYAHILKKLEATYQNGKGNLDECLDLVESLRACDPSQSERAGQWTKSIFTAIKRQKQEALEATLQAKASEAKAKKAQVRADSIAGEAQRAARRAYANDLAYKSQIALQRGDRTTAFRLAEFAHRYVDDDNLQVTRALVDALYYNDVPTHPPLPWASNLEGHTSSVRSVAFSPDGKRLATGSYDNTAKIWDLDSGKAALTLEGHTNWVLSVAFSPDGKRLATGSEDKTAKIWDLDSGKAALTLEGHTSSVWSVAFSPDGKRLATGSDDNTAKIWDLDSGKAALTLEGHTSSVRSVAFSPDGKRLATGSEDKTAKIWDLDSGKAALTLEGHTNWVLSVAFSPDGKRLATGSEDKTAKIWDLDSGKAALTLEGHTSSVRSVAFSPDGKRLATGSDDNTAKIWDLDSGKAALTLEGHTSSVLSVAFSPACPEDPRGGKRLATGSDDNTAKIWDLDSGKAALTLEGHTSSVRSVAFSPDGKRLATGSDDNTAKIWDLDSGKAALTLEGHTSSVLSVAFSPDGKRLATGSDDNTAKIWDLDSGKAALTLEGHTSSVLSVAFSPACPEDTRGGKRLATGSYDNTAKIWDLDSGKAALTLKGHTNWVLSVAFSPDGKRLATGSDDNTAKIWDLDSGKAALTLEGHTNPVLSVAFSPVCPEDPRGGKRLATGSYDKTAKIWDLDSGKAALTLEGHTNLVSSVAFSPACPEDPRGGKRLATGSYDKTAKIWDLDSGKAALTLEGHTSSIWSVAFSPACPEDPRGGKRLATGSYDKTAKIWETTAQGCLGVGGRVKRLAGLLLPQLSDYNLETLLDQIMGNEDSLMATREVWQIAAFAELYEQQTRNSQQLQRTAPYYARAARLYRAAANLADDSSFVFRLGDLYQRWAGDILESARPDTAQRYIELACKLGMNKSICPDLWQHFSEKVGKPLDFKRFLASENPKDLRSYGDYFFEKEKWKEAQQLYEKAEGKEHSVEVLQNLFTISEKTGGVFEFQRFMISEDAEELRGYGNYFFNKEKWKEAQQLYEKAEGKEHSAQVLQNLFTISEKTGENFEFQRFLISEDAEELRGYGDFFFNKKKWKEAQQLYEKAEGKEHSAQVLQNLFTISEKTGENFDFQHFLISEDVKELRGYGDYFFEKEKWKEAQQLYEKAEGKEHSAEVLQNLFAISEETGGGFDLNQFLSSENPEDLASYAQYFSEKECDGTKDCISELLFAIRLEEKWMTLDTAAAAREQLVSDLISLAYCQLFLPDGQAAEASLARASGLDAQNQRIAPYRACALLLQGSSEAEALFRSLKDKPMEGRRWKTGGEMLKWVLDNLEEEGVKGVDFAGARRWLDN